VTCVRRLVRQTRYSPIVREHLAADSSRTAHLIAAHLLFRHLILRVCSGWRDWRVCLFLRATECIDFDEGFSQIYARLASIHIVCECASTLTRQRRRRRSGQRPRRAVGRHRLLVPRAPTVRRLHLPSLTRSRRPMSPAQPQPFPPSYQFPSRSRRNPPTKARILGRNITATKRATRVNIRVHQAEIN
jgi:hypothetical protein